MKFHQDVRDAVLVRLSASLLNLNSNCLHKKAAVRDSRDWKCSQCVSRSCSTSFVRSPRNLASSDTLANGRRANLWAVATRGFTVSFGLDSPVVNVDTGDIVVDRESASPTTGDHEEV